MFRRSIAFHLAGAVCALGLLGLAFPQASLAAAAPSSSSPPAAAPSSTPPAAAHRHITVTVTDTGFQHQDYTVGFSPGTSSSGTDSGRITFVNEGHESHSATAVPGTLDEGVSFGERLDASGNVVDACWANGAKCGKMTPFDTGAIDPGGRVSLGIAPPDHETTYTITSATDCLNGNSNPQFNCTPVAVHVVSIPASSRISGTLPGSVVLPAGSPGCVSGLIDAPIGPDFCLSAVREPGKTAGSAKHPLGNTTVDITDFGYDPATVYVKPGSTVTWVNKGDRTHSVMKKGPQAPPDDYHNLYSGGLDTRQSYSYDFTLPGSFSYDSTVGLDLVQPSDAGGLTTHCSKHHNCGQPAVVGKVIVAG